MASALASQGRFAESLVAIKRGHELGSKRPDWRYPSAEWVRRVEANAAMEAKLPEFLSGQFQPATTRNAWRWPRFAERRNSTARRPACYAAAFAADPKLAADLEAGHRFDAICNAVMAAAGKGEDAAKLDDEEAGAPPPSGPRLASRRPCALDQATRHPARLRSRRTVAEKMTLWKQKPDLASIRDAAALAKLTGGRAEGVRSVMGGRGGAVEKGGGERPSGTPVMRRRTPKWRCRRRRERHRSRLLAAKSKASRGASERRKARTRCAAPR